MGMHTPVMLMVVVLEDHNTSALCTPYLLSCHYSSLKENYFFINFMLQSHATYHIKDFVLTLADFSSTQHEKSEGINIG